MVRCQVCGNPAYFNCSRCESSFYCSKQHQIEHWKSQHKDSCFRSKSDYQQIVNGLLKKRYHTRKQFYQNYSNKVFDLCLLDAKVMLDFDKRIKSLTKDIMDEFQYAGSVCLLCRAYYLVKDRNQARIIMQDYLAESQEFLAAFTMDITKNMDDREKQIYLRKMNLISTIANLCYALELDCIKYYVLYTKHVEKYFGKESFEASNCYFLIGCYFAEEGFLKKAIACFLKSAACRGQLAGDCYFNIGILYSFQKKYTKSLEMFETSLKLRMQQYGQDSDQLAQVQQNMGLVYLELNDFITAMLEYEKAFKIRSANPYSAEYRNVVDLIHQLYDKLSLYINSEQEGLKKPSIFLHLKTKIEDEEAYWKQRGQKKKTIVKTDQQQPNKKDKNKQPKQPQIDPNAEKPKGDSFFIITQQLISRLSAPELFQLSDLQLELSTTTSVFAKVYMVGRSQFLQKITPENLQMLRQDNTKLFELLRLEELEKKKK